MKVSYLTLEQFRDRTVMPSPDLDDVELSHPGWVLRLLGVVSGLLDARLRKRYAVPFDEPVPEPVLDWVNRIATMRAYHKRGVNGRDETWNEIKADAELAWSEVKEAAESKESLFDLPLRADTTATGISKGAPFVSSEAGPYDWMDRQIEQVQR